MVKRTPKSWQEQVKRELFDKVPGVLQQVLGCEKVDKWIRHINQARAKWQDEHGGNLLEA